jgi:hypothetical protein
MCFRFQDIERDKRVMIIYMLVDGPKRLAGLYSAMKRAGAGEDDLDLLKRHRSTLIGLRKKHYYEPPSGVITPAGILGASLVGLKKGSKTEKAVFQTCRDIYDLMNRREPETSSKLADDYRRKGIPSLDTNTWLENQMLGWVEAHQPDLLLERLGLGRGKPVR